MAERFSILSRRDLSKEKRCTILRERKQRLHAFLYKKIIEAVGEVLPYHVDSSAAFNIVPDGEGAAAAHSSRL